MNHCATNVNFQNTHNHVLYSSNFNHFFKGRIQTTENAIGSDQTQSQSGSNPPKTFSYEKPTNVFSGKQKLIGLLLDVFCLIVCSKSPTKL